MSEPDDIRKDPESGNLISQAPPDPALYWTLEAQSDDWQWLIGEAIVRKAGPKLEPTDAFVNITNVQHPVFYLRRERFSVEEIVKLTGYTGDPEAFAKAKIIRLAPVGDQSRWEKPTVPYAGAA